MIKNNLEKKIDKMEKAIKKERLIDMVTAWWNSAKVTFGGAGLGYALIQNYMNITRRAVAGYQGHEVIVDSLLISMMLGSSYLIGSGLKGIAEWYSKYNFISHKEYQKEKVK